MACILEDQLRRQINWSYDTFGPGHRTLGVLDHIQKEIEEIKADPLNIDEWVDIVILAFDGAWRTGASPDHIVRALLNKQYENENRQWPNWRTMSPDQAIEHIQGGEHD